MKSLFNMYYRLCAKLDEKLDEKRHMIINGDNSSSQYKSNCKDIDNLFTLINLIDDEIKEMENDNY